MISILIPVYNYNVSNLLQEIHRQCTHAKLKFEIICYDDNSTQYILENNNTVEALEYTRIIPSKKNLGRIQARQILSDHSIYDWLLFLDADVLPKSKNFLEQYIHKTTIGYDVIYGGFAYTKTQPNTNAILRWKYGKRFEEIDAKKRNFKALSSYYFSQFLN
jgi:glycosyltransferase involved in cell wall biosynthesis